MTIVIVRVGMVMVMFVTHCIFVPSGINSLAALVQVEPKIALDYQMIVMECLDDVDETLKRKVQQSCTQTGINKILMSIYGQDRHG